MASGTVRFDVPAEVAFDYLVDPLNRPQWQSSLRRVQAVDGEVRVGQTWTDVTKPGLRPAMTTTELDRPTRWTESGTWRFVRADLTLTFASVGDDACEVTYSFRFFGLGPLGSVVSAVSRPAVGADLRRAAGILARL